MTGGGEYEVVLTAPARRALTDRLPEAVATAVVDCDGLAGVWSARRGAYQIRYRVRDAPAR